MSAAGTHRIETLRWELGHGHARSAAGAQDLHARLMRFLREQGLAEIEAAFDQACPADQVWTLPRLTLDLGVIRRHQSERQWRDRLGHALRAALAQAAAGDAAHPSLPMRRGDDAAHQVLQFLSYLRTGHLPWGVSLPGRQALSGWLERLARRHGAALWRDLQRDPARDRLLTRLSLISPHGGLHALVAQRDPALADQLAQLDELALMPLQASGRLGAYQRGQLQQALRVAAVRHLWHRRGGRLSGAGRRALVAEWRRLFIAALGADWRQLLRRHLGLPPAEGRQGDAVARGSAHVPVDGPAGLLADLMATDESGGAPAADDPQATSDGPGRVWDHALLQLQALLRQRRPAQEGRLRRLLQSLAAAQPALLRQRLLGWAAHRRERRAWSLALSPTGMGRVIATMSARPLPGLSGSGATHWAESLRQTALRLQREAPAGHRPGLGRLQALLMQASLQALLEGRRLPDQHQGWQALWQQAWLDWQRPGNGNGNDHDDRPVASVRDTPAVANDDNDDFHPPPPRRRVAEAADQALLHLEQQCREGRWAWPQRLRLARLLETRDGVVRWLRLFDEPRRWRMLQAQFGELTAPLKQRASRLARWLKERSGGAIGDAAATLAEHWRRLCGVLFIRGLRPDPSTLRRHYQSDTALHGAGDGDGDGAVDDDRTDGARRAPVRPGGTSGRETAPDPGQPIWVDDAGQVLLAAYAERLFKHLGLLADGRFIDDAARSRGVQCLQTLCHGPGPSDESATVLSRLLCGAAPHEPLPAPAPLDAPQLELLEQLLAAVVAHWKALGGTSVQGLRESFLQRQGRLHQERVRHGEPPRWRLRVQTRGFDVLLDRLPWSFHTIRLPWMQGVLHVEWR